MSDRQVDIVLGPPGTGKTTRLLEHLSTYLDRGGSPERVAFVSFSRRAVREVAEKLGRSLDDFPHFRTIHSTAYQFLGLDRDDVMQPKHWKMFSELVGIPFATAQFDEPLWDGNLGNRCMALHDLSRARGTDIEHEWRAAMFPDLPLKVVKEVVRLYEKFKDVNALWDFHDMIEKAEGTLDVDILFVDEAQDTSRSQWSFLRRAARDVRNVVIAGDDDQTVYAWSGADGDALRRFFGTQTVLPHSYRLPEAIRLMATGIAERIHRRVPKLFNSRVDPETGEVIRGAVEWRNDINSLDLRGANTWLLLARSNYQLDQYRTLARSQGVIYTLPDGEWSWTLPSVRAAVTYEKLRKGQEVLRTEARVMCQFLEHKVPRLPATVTWNCVFSETAAEVPWMKGLPNISPSDREYIRALVQGGESVTKPGRVRIGTVHSVKGAEADKVVLCTDISSRVAHGARIDPDSEHRVQYVGVTRARESLTLLYPTTATHWRF